MFDLAPEQEQRERVAKVIVLGVGGAGGNTVNSMMEAGFDDIEFMVANTDSQALRLSSAPTKIQLGVKLTKGLGAGANPEIGKRAAEEDLEQIMEIVADADIVFLTAGMGGGTGSGALPVVARALKERGILSIAFVTKPFNFEGKYRLRIAHQAVELLKQEVDTLVVIPNQKLLEEVDESTSMIDAFKRVNEMLYHCVKSIHDIIRRAGHINVDFADLRTIMKDMGTAVMGTAKASGPDRAVEAATRAISSPLLENMNIKGARGVLLNVCGGPDLALHEIHRAASVIQEQAADDANIIIGSVIDENLHDELIVTVIATGFGEQEFGVQQQIKTDPVKADHVKVPSPSEYGRQGMQSYQSLPEHAVKPGMYPQQSLNGSPLAAGQPTFKPGSSMPQGPNNETMDELDIPAFMRKSAQQQEG